MHRHAGDIVVDEGNRCQGGYRASQRLILMGDWCDSGFTRVGSQCIEETDVMKKLGTGAVFELA